MEDLTYSWTYGASNSIKMAPRMSLSQFDLIGFPAGNGTITRHNRGICDLFSETTIIWYLTQQNLRHWTNAVLMLARRIRRRTNIKTTSIHVFNVTCLLCGIGSTLLSVGPSNYDTSTQCWADAVDGGPTLVQHWVDVSCLLGTPLTTSMAVFNQFYFVKRSDVTRWKQGYIRTLPHTLLY